jgi:hypothetical protein
MRRKTQRGDKRMTTNKPPMTLYFRENISTVYMDISHMDNRFGQAFASRKREADVGPYILKDWLKEELLKRAREGMRGYASPEKYSMELGRAIKDIFRELNGGKNEL